MNTSKLTPTNAASSGIKLEKAQLKSLAKRRNSPAIAWLSAWLLALVGTGVLVSNALGSWWIVPAMILYGTVLTVPAYALSHECAHGTAFRSRWLNESVLWISSLIYFEEPYHRRYSHTRHHTHTWHVGLDSQMPFDTPMTFWGWIQEVSGISFIIYESKIFIQNALGKFNPTTIAFTPATELPKLKWGARICLLVYAATFGLIVSGIIWPLIYLVIPRLVGGPVMLLFTLPQHVEMQENSPSILESTRSYRLGAIGRFLYLNMNWHIEHHLYPQIPFYALPGAARALRDQLPEPDPGFFRTNWEVLMVAIRRSLGRPTKAPTIRQAPGMIGSGRDFSVTKASMK